MKEIIKLPNKHDYDVKTDIAGNTNLKKCSSENNLKFNLNKDL